MTYSIWDAYQSFWNNSGGGGSVGGRAYTGIWYGGTGTGGSIAGHLIGGAFDALFSGDGAATEQNVSADEPYIDMDLLYDAALGATFQRELPYGCALLVVHRTGQVPDTIMNYNLTPVANWSRDGHVQWWWNITTAQFPDGSSYRQPGPAHYQNGPECDLERLLDGPWDDRPPDFIPGNYTTYTFIQKTSTSGVLVETTFGTTGNDAMSGSGILLAKEGNDGLTGSTGDDALYGGSGNDWLDGGAGRDLLDGGDGWDVASYLSATSGITVDLTTNQNSGAALGDVIVNVEVLQGTNFNDMLTGVDRGGGNGVQLYGEGGDDGLIGKAGGDRLYGGDGNDWLDGGAGGDLLDGGNGWDVVSYLNSEGSSGGVTVNMTTNQNGGGAAGDTLVGIEVLQGTNANDTLIGVDRGNGNGVQLYGEGGDDGLTGKAGGDALYGGAGNDWLDGGPGSDILDGGDGWDVVSYLSANGGITVDLTTNQNGGAAAGDRISNVEVLQGTNASDYLTGVDRGGGNGVQLYGEGGNDTLTGKAGGDALFGGSGNDWLNGDGGSDVLNGGAGADRFALLTAPGAGNVDTIQDFSGAEGDQFVLGRGAFTTLAAGVLSSAAFKLGTVASTAEQHILYNQSTGELFYDVDGSGAQAAIKIAALNAGTVLAASHFLVV